MQNKKIHIVYIIPTLQFGGAERFVVDLINNLEQDIFSASIIALKNNLPLKSELRADCPVHLVEKKGQLSFGLFKALENKLQELKPDIAHTHLFGADFWGRVAAKRLGLPIVTTEHSIKIDESIIKTLIKKHLRDYSDVYTAPSQAIANHLRDTYGIKKEIKIIPNGIDLQRFVSLPAPRFAPSWQLLILGRLAPEKGHSIALRALAELKQFDWQLKIVGEGSEKNNIINLIKELNLINQVELISPRADVPNILAKSQILLMPSINEGLGIVAMEAMSASRLFIGSRIGGIPEVITDQKTGLLAEAGDINDWAEKLQWVFNHPADAEEMIRNAKKYAQENFGADKMAGEYEEIYENIIHHS